MSLEKDKKDRVLGDEWKDWDGNLKNTSQSLDEKKGTFFLFLFFLVFVTALGSYFVLYLIAPRLTQINSTLYRGVFYFTIACTVLLFLWYFSLLFSVSTGKRIAGIKRMNQGILKYLIDRTVKIGMKFGISRDRMGNSFLKVFNVIVLADYSSSPPLRPLIILPRCLEKELRDRAMELSKKYGLDAFVVGGGEAAKAKITEIKPEAIIGVACERDLLSGIKEVRGSVPVIGIPNLRPNGPCKETLIDIGELEKTIRYFLKI